MNKSSMQAPTATSKFTGTTGPMGITNIIGEQDEGRMAAQTPAPSLVQPQSSALTGGQPAGLQQGMQEKMFSNASTGVNSTADPQMCRVVQQQMNHSSSPVDAEQTARAARRLSIQECIQSLVHACQCGDANCDLPKCKKIKRMVIHTMNCKRKANGGCYICKQLIALCCYHAKYCKETTTCLVLFCSNIKHNIKQRQLQQQLKQAQLLRMQANLQQSMQGQMPGRLMRL
ncbi:PREDICTED: histone acetyltransferase p300-like isoform X2 [Wasmannia auropunctata]|uniref:histone acetyltransferase p300-like isoform X2 n=1 Tax=Wasmannia auropunctata TaxID=64793 RepID=UPI0005EDA68D|nr:PREDICTED: histone acetyltransferase p300-like isoform X2 [Wasmannia auropunctata]